MTGGFYPRSHAAHRWRKGEALVGPGGFCAECHADNLRRAVDALRHHIGRCRWCRRRVKKHGLTVKLCTTGEEFRRVVEYRRNPEDATPR